MNYMLFALNSMAANKERKSKNFVPGRIDSSTMKIDIYHGDEYHIKGKYAVVYSPANLEHFNGKGCCITIVSSNGVNGNLPLPLLIIDEYFNHLSENAKQYMICHEFGHLISGHLDELISAVRAGQTEPFTPTRSFVQECEADMNAVRLMGKENTLAAMKECILVFEDVANVREMGQRAEYIKYNAI